MRCCDTDTVDVREGDTEGAVVGDPHTPIARAGMQSKKEETRGGGRGNGGCSLVDRIARGRSVQKVVDGRFPTFSLVS